MDGRSLAVMGTGQAYPGEPVGTRELLVRIAERYGVELTRIGLALGRRLNIQHRHLARDFAIHLEGTRPGDSNPDLAARAVRAALAQAGLRCDDLAYLVLLC
jgi:3-oxoacyl-[acyl-carrier-protein] synthase-3